jgi:16S rRNA (uracil1498-N3)-methyltransferase
MRVHRFFLDDEDLGGNALYRLVDVLIVRQLTFVFRCRVGEEIVLFNGKGIENQYKIQHITKATIDLELMSECKKLLPLRRTHLIWSLLKKDKNELILQKCTELGITDFWPVISDRTEKTGFDHDRAHKIVVEAAEQCGRHDIPVVHETLSLKSCVDDLAKVTSLYVADMDGRAMTVGSTIDKKPYAICIGPEGGWSDAERAYFNKQNIKVITLSTFTLRSETAVIAAATIMN